MLILITLNLIIQILKNDKKGHIVKAIESFASNKKSIIDIGCAVGKWIPVLSPLFKQVHAIDISSKNLQIAEKKYSALKNISYERVDMSAKTLTSKTFDAAICINAILTSDLKKRNLFFKHMASFLQAKGDLVLVVPSLESKLFSHIIANKYNVDDAKKVLGRYASQNGAKLTSLDLDDQLETILNQSFHHSA